MFNFLAGLPVYAAYAIMSLAIIIVFYLGYKLSALIGILRFNKERKRIESQQETVQKSLKNILDTENKELEKKVETLKAELDNIHQKTENYRKKIAGLGGLNAIGANKKRAEILYSLLLENELLEDVLKKRIDKIIADDPAYKDDFPKTSLDMERRRLIIREVMQSGHVKSVLKDIIDRNKDVQTYKEEIEKKLRSDFPQSQGKKRK